MATTGDSKMDAPAGKRKREALGEVTLVTNNKSTVAGKAKEKNDPKKEKFDGVVLKSKIVTTRQPLRTVAGTRQSTKTTTASVNSTGLEDVKEEVKVIKVPDEDAMVVDPAPPQLRSITVRRSLVARESAIPPRRSDAHRRVSVRSITGVHQHGVHQHVAEDAEADRVFKKRRTSSDAPDEYHEAEEEAQLRVEEAEAAEKITAEIEAYANEDEADPERSAWDDLDADDIDDPLMVSEYVVDIFQYLKQVEVRISSNQNRHED
jgi:G2/mitotic-specific cyclin 2